MCKEVSETMNIDKNFTYLLKNIIYKEYIYYFIKNVTDWVFGKLLKIINGNLLISLWEFA